MRDQDGRALSNAHLVGFLRRIAKLLFYGIKPVFVFDGGAPVLKTTTLRERREKRSGAAASHAKIAEKILAAQMRREALNQVDSSHGGAPKSKGKRSALDDDKTVYLEEIDPTMAKTPARKKPTTPGSSSKKPRFYDHDPYKLPDVDLEAAIAKATRTAAPDPRLATEDELRAFIEDMRPEDFDVTSPAFRELPTEVQYEIVGDLRLKSRQTSYARLQNMLRNAPTPLDFSKQQIKNLRQRNTLTQQLLITTDSIGSAHISIPVRIASERNKEYVLMKNEGESGGWILGIRDDGTRQKPIEIDHDKPLVYDDSDEDMEEVAITTPAFDPDLRGYQQTMALSAIGNRSSGEQRSVPNRPIDRKGTSKPLFHVNEYEEQEDLVQVINQSQDYSDVEEDMVAIAIQESLNESQNSMGAQQYNYTPALGEPSSSKMMLNAHRPSTAAINPLATPVPEFNGEDFTFESPSRLDTALSFANTGISRPQLFPPSNTPSSTSIFGRPTLLISPRSPVSSPVRETYSTEKTQEYTRVEGSPSRSHRLPTSAIGTTIPDKGKSRLVSAPPKTTSTTKVPLSAGSDSHAELPEDLSISISKASPTSEFFAHVDRGKRQLVYKSGSPEPILMKDNSPLLGSDSEQMEEILTDPIPKHAVSGIVEKDSKTMAHNHIPEPDEQLIPWSRSPSPSNELPTTVAPPGRTYSPTQEEWDAVEEIEEMDPQAEEGEYARFISQVKGKNIEEVRREIEDEIQDLNRQKKIAMRDSEDISQQMISQIMAMLRLFGIPYITAPMEAEAQCAELITLGLVDGVITDDSDVFLFGAQRVFKNMFNQSKTVECFLLSDLARDLGLERDTLIRLAYLLGSDYTDGLPGVGPVVAMELLKEFPGEDGLQKFRDWWLKVQVGKDKDEENKSKFRRSFKKKFKDLYLTEEWPNPAVRDAYYHPTVDSSEEPFKWGLPDLDALREFFYEELGWGQVKVDEILLPIIQKMNKRGQAAALNKQSNLNDFFNLGSGSGTLAPKKRQAYASKRLQNVVDEFRKKRARGSQSLSNSESEVETAPTKKRARKIKAQHKSSSKAGTKGKAVKRKAAQKPCSESDEEIELQSTEETLIEIPADPVVIARLRPRPKPKFKKQTSDIVDEEK
ncbi:hypothetical protein H0H81_008933 [Sphagnurus paluster]|uniref:PIN domain-like protein n=1 Tax=Sphagnurus paluster TaxID=117069 RepID=A0A9P7GKC8_9AGAR|nr:hypothetical protein H0H81_008933 [Sphagnurus paluster]